MYLCEEIANLNIIGVVSINAIIDLIISINMGDCLTWRQILGKNRGGIRITDRTGRYGSSVYLLVLGMNARKISAGAIIDQV